MLKEDIKMKHQTFKIYKLNKKISKDGFKQLEIGGKISFLKDILLKNCSFLVNERGEWLLNFFADKSYEQSLFISQDDLDFKVYRKLTTASIIISSSEFSDNDAEKLSMAIRQSKSIKRNDFIEYPSHYSHIDGRGLSFFSKIDNQQDNFYRQLILLSLAYSYLGAIEFITNKLAEKVNCQDCNIDELNKLYIEAAKFNSVFFFHQPVLIDKASLTEMWKEIDKILEVNTSSDELLEQLSNVHYILNLDSENKKIEKEKIQHAKQEKWNFVFAIIGIFIGIIELLK